MLAGGVLGYLPSALSEFTPRRRASMWRSFSWGIDSHDQQFGDGASTVAGLDIHRLSRGRCVISAGAVVYGGGRGKNLWPCSAALLAAFYMLARFGIRDILNTAQPWRALVFLILVVGVLFGGFRSFMLSLMVVVFLQLYLEGTSS